MGQDGLFWRLYTQLDSISMGQGGIFPRFHTETVSCTISLDLNSHPCGHNFHSSLWRTDITYREWLLISSAPLWMAVWLAQFSTIITSLADRITMQYLILFHITVTKTKYLSLCEQPGSTRAAPRRSPVLAFHQERESCCRRSTLRREWRTAQLPYTLSAPR